MRPSRKDKGANGNANVILIGFCQEGSWQLFA